MKIQVVVRVQGPPHDRGLSLTRIVNVELANTDWTDMVLSFVATGWSIELNKWQAEPVDNAISPEEFLDLAAKEIGK